MNRFILRFYPLSPTIGRTVSPVQKWCLFPCWSMLIGTMLSLSGAFLKLLNWVTDCALHLRRSAYLALGFPEDTIAGFRHSIHTPSRCKLSYSLIASNRWQCNLAFAMDTESQVKKVQLPAKFLACVKQGSWLRTSVGYKPPNQSFLSSSEWGVLLQSGSSFVDIPMIDQKFYQNKLHLYWEELKAIGVRFEFQ